LNHDKSRNKLFTAVLCLTLCSIAFAQAPANPDDKSAPKVSYILAGRLFDATSDSHASWNPQKLPMARRTHE